MKCKKLEGFTKFSNLSEKINLNKKVCFHLTNFSFHKIKFQVVCKILLLMDTKKIIQQIFMNTSENFQKWIIPIFKWYI